MRDDALKLANELDDAWHDQARSFEREAVTRFWGLLTLPARVLRPQRPREMLRDATVLRNARFKGAPVREMFFADKDFTEVDALFLRVGSSLGHLRGDDAWVVEVERKSANHQGDYYVAIHRARRFAALLADRFQARPRPVVIYEDAAGKYSSRDFEDDVLLIPMSVLRERTAGLSFPALADLPGLACDKTLVKLALLRRLVGSDPHHPGWYGGPLALARSIAEQGISLQLPVAGHQDTERLPSSIPSWLNQEREADDHLASRIDRYLDELHDHGMLEQRHPSPRLSLEGGQVALRLLCAEREDPR